jgi:hypothetical protein
MASADLGFRAEGVLKGIMLLPRTRYPDSTAQRWWSNASSTSHGSHLAFGQAPSQCRIRSGARFRHL